MKTQVEPEEQFEQLKSESKWALYGSMLSAPINMYFKMAENNSYNELRKVSGATSLSRYFIAAVFGSYFSSKTDFAKFTNGGKAFFDSISPLKVLNPFKLITAFTKLYSLVVSLLVDRSADLFADANNQREIATGTKIAKLILNTPALLIGIVNSFFATVDDGLRLLLSNKKKDETQPELSSIQFPANHDEAAASQELSSDRVMIDLFAQQNISAAAPQHSADPEASVASQSASILENPIAFQTSVVEASTAPQLSTVPEVSPPPEEDSISANYPRM